MKLFCVFSYDNLKERLIVVRNDAKSRHSMTHTTKRKSTSTATTTAFPTKILFIFHLFGYLSFLIVVFQLNSFFAETSHTFYRNLAETSLTSHAQLALPSSLFAFCWSFSIFFPYFSLKHTTAALINKLRQACRWFLFFSSSPFFFIRTLCSFKTNFSLLASFIIQLVFHPSLVLSTLFPRLTFFVFPRHTCFAAHLICVATGSRLRVSSDTLSPVVLVLPLVPSAAHFLLVKPVSAGSSLRVSRDSLLLVVTSALLWPARPSFSFLKFYPLVLLVYLETYCY